MSTSSTRHRSSVGAAAPLIAAVALVAAACGDSGVDADAGDDVTVAVGEAPVFDGCGSDGEIVNYRWVITGAPESAADDVGKSIREEMSDCSFTLDAAMVADEVGDWTIELSISDADGNSDTDSVVVTVEP